MGENVSDAGSEASVILDKMGWKRRDGQWVSPSKGVPKHGYGVAEVGSDDIVMTTVDTSVHGAMVKWLNAQGLPATVGWSLGYVKTEFKRRAGDKFEVVEVTAYAVT